MKKQLVIGIFLTLVLATISMISNNNVVAHSEDDPLVITLYAGQTIAVGEVHVWNDEDNIHVEYVITNTEHPWVITETHLYVGKTDPTGLTSTPGQFPYPQYFEPGVDSYEYVIALSSIDGYHLMLNKNGQPTGVWEADGTPGVEPEDDVYIAAHAVVEYEIVSYDCINLVSDETVQWLGLDGTTWTNAVYCYEHPSWPKISGVNYIWRTYLTDVVYEYDNVPTYDSGKYGWFFKKDFSLPTSAYNIVGSIDLNVDNSYELFLNNVLVGAQGTMNRDGPDSYEWNDIRNYAINPLPGANTLSFRALNYFRIWDSYSNPAGITFKASICYDYISEYQEETAWADGTNFGTNWAEYFTYDIQGWELLETLTIPATGAKITSGSLECGDYKYVASGTCNWRIPGSAGGYLADAEYWLRHDQYGEGWTHMGIWSLAMWNGAPVEVEWGALNEANHIYSYETSICGPVTFFFNDDVYGDNSGSLTVEIYHWV